ncbi:hemin uptake protein HemP [Trichlorobacter ammonificans]|nr:hemin uptake protein HemP [Trichlorobacter ammonificans]
MSRCAKTRQMPRRATEKGRPDMSGKALASTALFGDQKMLVILHNGEEYRLRITSSNKLILTK